MHIQELTSLNNEVVKEVHSLHQKKARDEKGLFIVEGEKGVLEAIKANLEIVSVFILEGFDESLLNGLECNIYKVNEKILKKISTTETSPPVLAVVKQLYFKMEDMFKFQHPLILVLENIKDAGNLGTIVRTSVAANVAGIVLAGNCVDIYNPKTVRSSVGNLWKLPIVSLENTKNIKEKLNSFSKLKFLATTVRNDKKNIKYTSFDYKKPLAIMFGSEAEGLSEELLAQADEFIHIPMNKTVESLNLSISMGVIIYESFRQKEIN